jgi:molybdenum cofactor cytidylyltransferase
VTVATLGPYACVAPGEVVATVKIIPFAVASDTLARALSGRGETPPMSLRPFRPRSVGLVLTRVPGGRERLLDKAAETLAMRLHALGSSLGAEVRCPHETTAVAEAVAKLLGRGSEVVVVGSAAATVDRRDVVPAGIEQAGGVVEHFGMPVEPGNLLVLARAGAVPVIGMPGCARSIKTNGFDWVLRRVLAGVTVTGRDVMGMGVGGLLDAGESRTLRLGSAVREGVERRLVTERPRIAAIVLAAGQSKRMGARNKLLAEIDGKPMVARAVDAAIASRADPVVVVTGHDRETVENALAGRDVTMVHAAAYERGMSASLKRGIEALSQDVDGAVICLGDMPRVAARHIDRLIQAFDPAADAAICVTYNRGKRGNPVLWGRQFFTEMQALEGDVGARALLQRYADLVQPVDMDEPGLLLDVDEPADLAVVTGSEGTDG